MTIRIITDTTADITAEEAAEWNIDVLPMRIFFGQESYVDNVTMTKDQFYDRILQNDVPSATSQPSTQEYANAYKKMEAEGASQIILIHMSKNFSHMYESASQAIEMSGVKIPITIYDSNTISSAMGIIVLAAAKMAKSGASKEAIIARLDYIRDNTYAFILFNDLKYFAQSGRADKIKNFLGASATLNTKHIFCIKNGEFTPAFHVRSYAKGMKKLLDIVHEAPQIEDVAISYTTNRQDAEFLSEILMESLPAGKVRVSQASAILGSHGGPDTLGIAYRVC